MLVAYGLYADAPAPYDEVVSYDEVEPYDDVVSYDGVVPYDDVVPYDEVVSALYEAVVAAAYGVALETLLPHFVQNAPPGLISLPQLPHTLPLCTGAGVGACAATGVPQGTQNI